MPKTEKRGLIELINRRIKMTKKGLIDRLSQYPDDIPIKIAVGNEGEDGYQEFDLKDIQGRKYSLPERYALISLKTGRI